MKKKKKKNRRLRRLCSVTRLPFQKEHPVDSQASLCSLSLPSAALSLPTQTHFNNKPLVRIGTRAPPRCGCVCLWSCSLKSEVAPRPGVSLLSPWKRCASSSSCPTLLRIISPPTFMELHHDTESDLEKAPLHHVDYISQIFFFIYLFRTGTFVGVCSYGFSFYSGLP